MGRWGGTQWPCQLILPSSLNRRGKDRCPQRHPGAEKLCGPLAPGGGSALSFNVLAIRSGLDTGDDALDPVLSDVSSPDIIDFDAYDGPNVVRVVATAVCVMRVRDGGLKTLTRLRDIKIDIYITDGRLALACVKYDKGGGWVGFGTGALVAVTANAISKARAARRSRGKVLVGHIRYPWVIVIVDIGLAIDAARRPRVSMGSRRPQERLLGRAPAGPGLHRVHSLRHRRPAPARAGRTDIQRKCVRKEARKSVRESLDRDTTARGDHEMAPGQRTRCNRGSYARRMPGDGVFVAAAYCCRFLPHAGPAESSVPEYLWDPVGQRPGRPAKGRLGSRTMGPDLRGAAAEFSAGD